LKFVKEMEMGEQRQEKNRNILLQISSLNMRFGGLAALQNICLNIWEGTLCSIIGPNGAGKTTLFNVLSGFITPTSGKVYFDGCDITGLKPYHISRLGLSRSYQVTNIFPKLTALENVRIAVQSRSKERFKFLKNTDKLSQMTIMSEEILQKIGLLGEASKLGNELSHGNQRALEVGISLATSPKLLLLDEPTSGLAPHEAKTMIQLIKEISKDQTIVLIEHNMNVVMAVSDRIVVLHQGEAIADGNPEEVKNNVDVKRAYFGGLKNA
jgi:branched-chain amino acid transport system ATP-binding protein